MFIKRLPQFEYHYPKSLPELFSLMAKYGDKAKLLAGGTDLLVSMKKREISPDHLINLKEIPELKGISFNEREGLRIGALTTIDEIEQSEIVKNRYQILWEAVSVMASPQIRTLGTIGGNLASAIPSADTAPPLIALGASLTIKGISSERKCLVEEFFKGPGESVLKTDEILTEIRIPVPPERSAGTYLKMMRRNALDLAIVGVATFLKLDRDKKICEDVKIVLGAVAPTPIRAIRAEKLLIGKELNEAIADEAGRIASEESKPISDVRASKEYRKTLVHVLTRRGLIKVNSMIRERS
jgi:carbon-monoxide dehydrogenase medium subunit